MVSSLWLIFFAKVHKELRLVQKEFKTELPLSNFDVNYFKFNQFNSLAIKMKFYIWKVDSDDDF